MAAAPIETMASVEITETITHAIMDLLSLPYSVTPDGSKDAEASPFYLLHCPVDEMRPRQTRDAIFTILQADPSLKAGEHYRTLPGYQPPLIGLNVELLNPEERAALLQKLKAYARISPTAAYLGHRTKGDQKGAFFPLKSIAPLTGFIQVIVQEALDAAQCRLNAVQITQIMTKLSDYFDLSFQREAIKKVLGTTTIQRIFLHKIQRNPYIMRCREISVQIMYPLKYSQQSCCAIYIMIFVRYSRIHLTIGAGYAHRHGHDDT